MCVTYQNGTGKLYVNGSLASTNDSGYEISTSSGPLRIFGDGWDDYFYGYLAALRIYDRVLEDSEIQALAAEFTPTPSA